MSRILLATLFVSIIQFVSAQSTFIGLWEGKLNAGVELRIVFNIVEGPSNIFSATMDSPDQGMKGFKVSTVKVSNDSLRLEIDQFRIKYSGKLTGDSTVTGVFTQGVSIPLNLKKVTKVNERKRPQTPVDPFPYRSEDVEYTNKDKTINYGATITIPSGQGPFPAVLLITGSGQQNRDEEIIGHRPFAVIADHLTRRGFIVLRVDDRGTGKTTGDVPTATTRDFANDATVSLNYLKSRREVNKKKIGLLGHSEGGIIAQMLGAERADLDFIIFLAAPGEKTIIALEEQNEAILGKAGVPRSYIDAYLDLYKRMVTTIGSSDNAKAEANALAVVNDWISKTPSAVVTAMTRITDEESKGTFVKAFVGQVGSPWFRFFLGYDPATNLKKIRAKVLALNGDKDVQVISKTNLSAIESALRDGKTKKFEIKELSGLNHLFQECNSCSMAEYGQLEQTISPKALEVISDWLEKNQ